MIGFWIHRFMCWTTQNEVLFWDIPLCFAMTSGDGFSSSLQMDTDHHVIVPLQISLCQVNLYNQFNGTSLGMDITGVTFNTKHWCHPVWLIHSEQSKNKLDLREMIIIHCKLCTMSPPLEQPKRILSLHFNLLKEKNCNYLHANRAHIASLDNSDASSLQKIGIPKCTRCASIDKISTEKVSSIVACCHANLKWTWSWAKGEGNGSQFNLWRETEQWLQFRQEVAVPKQRPQQGLASALYHRNQPDLPLSHSSVPRFHLQLLLQI